MHQQKHTVSQNNANTHQIKQKFLNIQFVYELYIYKYLILIEVCVLLCSAFPTDGITLMNVAQGWANCGLGAVCSQLSFFIRPADT